MMDDLITAIVFLIPVLLFLLFRKRFDRSQTAVAFGSVPLGCLTMIFVPALISMLFYFIANRMETNPPAWLQTLLELFRYLLGIVLGIAVIAYLAGRFSSEESIRSPLTFVGVFALLIIVGGAISIALTGFHEGTGNRDSSWHPIYLPKLQDVRVAFEQRPTHPFLAEYDYRLCLRKGDEKRYFNLWPETGGRTYISVYMLDDGRMFLRWKSNSPDWGYLYVIDAAGVQVHVLMIDEMYGKTVKKGDDAKEAEAVHYAVPLSSKAIRTMGSRDNIIDVTFDDGTTVVGVPFDINLDSRKYIGCIKDYSFYTPAQEPEGDVHPRYR
ncbi:MAG: hypothetical protein IJS15_13220 [Victivallales bacterium]|nr:hypothetical protein [Victivallales bacterium]